MKKTITKPEVKVMKLQKMNVIATSGGDTSYAPEFTAAGLNAGGDWNGGHSQRSNSNSKKAGKF